MHESSNGALLRRTAEKRTGLEPLRIPALRSLWSDSLSLFGFVGFSLDRSLVCGNLGGCLCFLDNGLLGAHRLAAGAESPLRGAILTMRV